MCESVQIINLPPVLYQELRQHCEYHDLGVVEFIEDTLEAAIHPHYLDGLLRHEREIKAKITKERKNALQDGFDRGVIAAVLTLRKACIPKSEENVADPRTRKAKEDPVGFAENTAPPADDSEPVVPRCGSEETIKLSAPLLQELRHYCDQKGLRFLDFIEKVLGTAIHRHQIEILINEQDKLKEMVAKKRRQAQQRGFDHGVVAATLVLCNKIIPDAGLIPADVRQRIYYRPVIGGQIKLFQ